MGGELILMTIVAEAESRLQRLAVLLEAHLYPVSHIQQYR
jgi:hypothetical protein